jgi:hypothetical protein
LRACTELADPDTVVEEDTTVSRELFSYLDDLSDAMIRTYRVEHEAWSTSTAAARAGLVRSLLGAGPARGHGGVSRALGYNLRRTHEAVVVWSDTPDTGSALQAVAIEVLRGHGDAYREPFVGITEDGTPRAGLYRIHSPVLLVEYDNHPGIFLCPGAASRPRPDCRRGAVPWRRSAAPPALDG